ncbi:MAG: electron transfer flavoprotein subunit beta/FixA family protein [Dehalococcoidia bacterium]|nr:electron transfer flavoprotein subunit beta/FixA family protein [Dehalococcoidia bacterium]
MHLVVCAKQIPDPETPASAFRIDAATNRVVPAPGLPLVLSQFDGIAAEAALRIKEGGTGHKITVISLGEEQAAAAIKQVLAMGADEGVLLRDAAFEDGDSHTTATALAAAIRKLGDVDVVCCGRQAADWDMGQVGLILAELLDWPVAPLAQSVEAVAGGVRVRRGVGDGFETIETSTPAVVTVSNELGTPRYPRLPQIMAAAKKPIVTWGATDLGLDPAKLGAAGRRLVLERLALPTKGGNVRLIEGDTPAEQAAALVAQLRADRVL